MKLYFIAGEASGDARGAELMRSLREREPHLEYFGRGGPQMRALADASFHDWSERAGVLGIIDVVKSYTWFRKQFEEALSEIARLRPAAVVLIDYPGFNLRVAAALKKQTNAPRIIYYISPQVWAWHRSRIPKMARTVDLMMCIFPFEKTLYEKSGLKTVFVGHPILDSLALKLTGKARENSLVGLFPGSRKREIERIFPVMLAAADALQRKKRGLCFEAAAASDAMRELMQNIAAKFSQVSCKIETNASHQLMQRASAGMVASGTATMEAAFFRLPFVLMYRTAWLTFFLGRRLVQVPWLGMPNLLAGREIVREFLQEEAAPESIALEVLRLIDDADARDRQVKNLGNVIALLGMSGASARAADAILRELRSPAVA